MIGTDESIDKEVSFERQLQDTKPNRKKLECQAGCKRDSDCKSDFLCTKDHKGELESLGLNLRKAYCGNVGSFNQHICYDPKEINVPQCKKGLFVGIENEKCSANDESCVIGPPICCRTLKRVTAYGKVVCTPRDCFYEEGCECVGTSSGFQWSCFPTNMNGCFTNCIN
jgi:hypothetical protein